MSFKKKPNRSANQFISNIKGLRVSVCCQPDSYHNSWIRELQRERLEITQIWPIPADRFDLGMDILICDYFPQMGNFIPWVPGDSKAALVVVLPQNGQYDEGVLLSTAPQCVIQRPISNSHLSTTLKVAWSQYKYERRLVDRISKLDENVRSARNIERAKMLIMNKQKIGEEAAYSYIRNLAMKRQLSVSHLASEILNNPHQAL